MYVYVYPDEAWSFAGAVARLKVAVRLASSSVAVCPWKTANTLNIPLNTSNSMWPSLGAVLQVCPLTTANTPNIPLNKTKALWPLKVAV